MAFRVQFRESGLESFRPAAKQPKGDDWIDHSFARERAVGRLRLPAVSNGRYEAKHPILDASGDTVGFLVDGQGSLGYTYACVHAGNCFWIAHIRFGAGDRSEVSIVDEAGSFLFSGKGAKFKVLKSFGFDGRWPATSGPSNCWTIAHISYT